jgi:hypothetical protein
VEGLDNYAKMIQLLIEKKGTIKAFDEVRQRPVSFWRKPVA